MFDETPGGNAAETEREMREHEAEARKRDPDERNPDAPGSGVAGDAARADEDDAAPPGTAGRVSNSGG